MFVHLRSQQHLTSMTIVARTAVLVLPSPLG